MSAAVADQPPVVAPATPAPSNRKIPCYIPILLSLPALIPLIWGSIAAWSAGRIPTGFVQYDMPVYVANARQHLVQGFHLIYSNPYAAFGSPQIYFQPHIFLLALLEWIGLGPGTAFTLLGLAAMTFASIVAARLYQRLVGWQTAAHKLGLICFFWGGGMLSLAGLAYGIFAHANLVKASLLFDPADGWWMLNFGRNLVYPTEAYYHGLFLLAILLLLERRFGWAVGCAALLAASHPFTGVSLVGILFTYAAIELILRSGAASRGLLLGSGAVGVLLVAYYIAFLGSFAEHKAMQDQWNLEWLYTPWTFFPALYLVGVLAFTRLTRWKALSKTLGDPRSRLFLVWFAAVFALTQHNLVMKPVQPIHFAHGYDWIALFFLAAPSLMQILNKAVSIRAVPLRVVAVAALLALFLSDNLIWFASFSDRSVQNTAISLAPDEKAVLDWLNHNARQPAYVVSANRWINYLTPTYTDLRAWSGHDLNTPYAAEKRRDVADVFSSGTFIAAREAIYYIPTRDENWLPPSGAREVFHNGSFVVWASDGR